MVHVPSSPLSYGSNIGCTSSTDHRLPSNGNQPCGRSGLGSVIIAWTLCIFVYLDKFIVGSKRLSHYLIRCVHRADFHFMEAYGLYYSYTQYWTHSSKGYLVHGPCFPRYTCLDIRKCIKFKRLSHYLNRCVHRADFHFMEAYGLYYSYTQYWTHSSKGYLVHGPCFPR